MNPQNFKVSHNKTSYQHLSKWYKHISKVQRFLNCMYLRSINCSPAELMTGIKMKIPEDINLMNLTEEEGKQHFIEK